MLKPRRYSYWPMVLALGLAPLTFGRAEAALMSFDIVRPGTQVADQRVATPVIPVCLVVQAPIKPTDYAKPTFDQPGFPAENPTAPEPASLITGLLGGGVALTAWARRRKKGPGQAEDAGGQAGFGEALETA